jgi:glycerol kinase
MPFIAAIDQGTTSTRCILFDQNGPVAAAQKEHSQIFPRPGWVEHDPLEIWQRTQEVVADAISRSGAGAGEIIAIGIANQRETTVVWDRETGQPYYNAIVWQDTRTKEICDSLSADGGQYRFRDVVGLPLATYFSAPKLKWIGPCHLRHHRFLAHLESYRRPARHRRHQRQPNDADESAHA